MRRERALLELSDRLGEFRSGRGWELLGRSRQQRTTNWNKGHAVHTVRRNLLKHVIKFIRFLVRPANEEKNR